MKKNLDLTIIITTFLILIISNLLIFSAASGGINFMTKQIIYSFIGIILGIIFFFIPTKAYKKVSFKLYIINLIILFLVLIIGSNINGSRRWFNLGFINLQPSELSKLIMIICLSVYFANRKKNITKPIVFWGSLLYTIIPVLFILKEPDLGTSIVILSIWFIMNFIIGTNFKNIIVFVLILAVFIGFVWWTPNILKPYQKERITTFINPENDSLDSGYHVSQSKIAIGSGSLLGQGFLNGGQRKLKFIPEQHTDFIFTVLGEEWGFVGSCFLLLLYAILIFRFIINAIKTDNLIDRGIIGGIAGMFLFQLFVNIAMTLGLMPVTGLPLIMVSYGGTSLIINLICIGLILGISYNNYSYRFYDIK